MTDRLAGTRTQQVVVVPDTRRVIRYVKDQVGNDLTAVLRWCDTHGEPVWEYGDGSSECVHDRITLVPSEHSIVDAPWEVQG